MAPWKNILVATSACLALAAPAWAQCRADLTGDGRLDVFDFLEFQDLFAAGDVRADFTGDGSLDMLDFLVFQDEFTTGCPAAAVELAGVPLDGYPHFTAVRAFNIGSEVTIAIDPLRFPAIAGRSADVYIVVAKSEAQWALDPALSVSAACRRWPPSAPARSATPSSRSMGRPRCRRATGSTSRAATTWSSM